MKEPSDRPDISKRRPTQPVPLKDLQISAKLLRWYKLHRRELPWRRTRDPYRIWISELMLQQTQVEQVIPYYHRFLLSFPTIQDLASASLDAILKIWQGLGYYRRASYAHQAARLIVRHHGAVIPSDPAILASLPGFGPYTCGAVLSIAYNKPVPAIDGNVIRVISRLFLVRTDISRPSAKREITGIVQRLLPPAQIADFTQALMEIGSLICTPKRPQCTRCCLKAHCRAYERLRDVTVLPHKKKKPLKPHFNIAVAVIRKGGRVLIAKRPDNVILGNLWEFPGGKQEAGEKLEATCRREIKEELSISIRILRHRRTIRHEYSHFRVTLVFFDCHHIKGTPKPKRSVHVRWVRIRELDQYAFPRANKKIVEELMAADSV